MYSQYTVRVTQMVRPVQKAKKQTKPRAAQRLRTEYLKKQTETSYRLWFLCAIS